MAVRDAAGRAEGYTLVGANREHGIPARQPDRHRRALPAWHGTAHPAQPCLRHRGAVRLPRLPRGRHHRTLGARPWLVSTTPRLRSRRCRRPAAPTATRCAPTASSSSRDSCRSRRTAQAGRCPSRSVRAVLANVAAAPGQAGSDVGLLVQVRVYLDDVANWSAFNAIYADWAGAVGRRAPWCRPACCTSASRSRWKRWPWPGRSRARAEGSGDDRRG